MYTLEIDPRLLAAATKALDCELQRQCARGDAIDIAQAARLVTLPILTWCFEQDLGERVH